MKTNINKKIIQIIASETRIRIMEELANGEKCVCVLSSIVKKSQPAVSQHLAILRGAGLVSVRRDGAMKRYSLAENGKQVLSDMKRW